MVPLEQVHPFAVHFPIAFTLSLFVLDLYARLKNIPLDGRGGVANLSAGLALLAGIGATVAASLGAAALAIATAGGVSESLTETHASLGAATASAIALWGLIRAFVWYRKMVLGNSLQWGIVIVELAIAAMIVITAYFGGQLVYEFGVNVNIPAG